MKTFGIAVDIFSAGIAIVLIIRLVLVMTSKDKQESTTNWIVGLVMVALAWTVISQVFRYDIGLFKVDGNRDIEAMEQTTTTNTPEEDSNVESHEVIIDND